MTDLGGYLLGSPLGFTTRSNPSIQLKAAGSADAAWSANPDFSRIPSDWLVGKNDNPILAMSVGRDKLYCPSDRGTTSEVLLEVPPDGWIVFEFTIDTPSFDKQGEFVHDNLKDVAEADIGATVFNWLVPGSHVVGAPENGRPFVGLKPEDLGIQPGASEEVIGLDLHMALFDSDLFGPNSAFFTGLLPNPARKEVRVFFTLQNEFVDANLPLVMSWLPIGSQLDPIGCIFVSTWVVDGGGCRWSKPELYRSLPCDKKGPITALAIDTSPAVWNGDAQDDSQHWILVSRRCADLDDKIEVGRSGTFPTMNPLRPLVIEEPVDRGSPPRTRVSRLIGAGRGLGDLCTADPVLEVEVRRGSRVVSTRQLDCVDDFAIARRLQAPEEIRGGTETRLSVAGFRVGKARPAPAEFAQPPQLHMRSIMSGPLEHGETVELCWWLVVFPSVATSVPDAPPIGAWHALTPEPQKFKWLGQPLVADYIYQTHLQTDRRHALAAIWRAGNRASPACVLRLG